MNTDSTEMAIQWQKMSVRVTRQNRGVPVRGKYRDEAELRQNEDLVAYPFAQRVLTLASKSRSMGK